MKKYIAPLYEKETIETEDIMNGSVVISQDGDTTNADMSAGNLFDRIEYAIRHGE